jgi:hypothetical protein
MLNLDDHPTVPDLPQFSQAMHDHLVAATGNPAMRRSPAVRPRVLAAGAVAAAAVVAGAVVGIDHAVTSSSPADRAGPTGPSGRAVHIHGATFLVDTNPGGTVTLTLTNSQIQDPVAVRSALRDAGVPALVTVGSVCTAGPSAVLNEVISPPQRQPDGSTSTTITPTAMPAGTELSIGYFHASGGSGIHITLVPTAGPLTCAATPPPPPHR